MEKNILIVCETGISAALLVSKFLEEVKNRNLNIDVDYAQMRKLSSKIGINDYDTIIVTPQVERFQRELNDILDNVESKSSVLYMTPEEFNYMNINSVLARINH